MSQTSLRVRILAEVSIFAALSAALYSVRIFTLPYGGSITAGSMVPIFWLSLRRGAKVGMFTGAVFGIIALEIDVLLSPFSPITNPVQVVAEYPFAFGLLGLAGLLKKSVTSARALVGVGIAIVCRFFVHFLAGILFWAWSVPEGWNPVAWSAVYNGSFLTGEFIISAFLILLLVRSGSLKMYL